MKEEKEHYSVTSIRLVPDINLNFIDPTPLVVAIVMSATGVLYDAEILNRFRSNTPLRDIVAKNDNCRVACGAKEISTTLVLFSHRSPR